MKIYKSRRDGGMAGHGGAEVALIQAYPGQPVRSRRDLSSASAGSLLSTYLHASAVAGIFKQNMGGKKQVHWEYWGHLCILAS